ncbi:MAG: acyloxyacyl hydrolase [Opitutales bacterium]
MTKYILSLSLLFICSLDALAGMDIDAYGLRLGYGTESGNDLFSTEAMFYFDYEREWEISGSVELELKPEASVGFIHGHSETAGTVHLGFAGFIELDDSPLDFVFSSGPTLLTEDTFGAFEMGGHLHFTSALGLDWEWGDDWMLGYRFQHISNAGLRDENPGLNLHVLAIAREF